MNWIRLLTWWIPTSQLMVMKPAGVEKLTLWGSLGTVPACWWSSCGKPRSVSWRRTCGCNAAGWELRVDGCAPVYTPTAGRCPPSEISASRSGKDSAKWEVSLSLTKVCVALFLSFVKGLVWTNERRTSPLWLQHERLLASGDTVYWALPHSSLHSLLEALVTPLETYTWGWHTHTHTQ